MDLVSNGKHQIKMNSKPPYLIKTWQDSQETCVGFANMEDKAVAVLQRTGSWECSGCLKQFTRKYNCLRDIQWKTKNDEKADGDVEGCIFPNRPATAVSKEGGNQTATKNLQNEVIEDAYGNYGVNEDVDSDDGITELSSDEGDEGDESIEEGDNEGDESDSDKLFCGSRIKRTDHAGLLMAFAICHNTLQDVISDLISMIGISPTSD